MYIYCKIINKQSISQSIGESVCTCFTWSWKKKRKRKVCICTLKWGNCVTWQSAIGKQYRSKDCWLFSCLRTPEPFGRFQLFNYFIHDIRKLYMNIHKNCIFYFFFYFIDWLNIDVINRQNIQPSVKKKKLIKTNINFF